MGYLGQLHFGLVSCRELVPDIDTLAGDLTDELALLVEAAEKASGGPTNFGTARRATGRRRRPRDRAGEAAAPAGIPAEIFAAAVDTFVAGQRLDMRSLARRLGVARATLYRRAWNWDRLLDEMLWWRARRLLWNPYPPTVRVGLLQTLAVILFTDINCFFLLHLG